MLAQGTWLEHGDCRISWSINEVSIGMSIAPFEGIKQSGLGSEGGTYGLEEYLVTKYTCMGLGNN